MARERRVILGLVSFQKTERKRSHSWLGKRDRARVWVRNAERRRTETESDGPTGELGGKERK